LFASYYNFCSVLKTSDSECLNFISNFATLSFCSVASFWDSSYLVFKFDISFNIVYNILSSLGAIYVFFDIGDVDFASFVTNNPSVKSTLFSFNKFNILVYKVSINDMPSTEIFCFNLFLSDLKVFNFFWNCDVN